LICSGAKSLDGKKNDRKKDHAPKEIFHIFYELPQVLSESLPLIYDQTRQKPLKIPAKYQNLFYNRPQQCGRDRPG